ncbi:retrovirus-related pol polyprotein from transposon TNT 1-94 [Tanacetum coccineum]
MFTVDRTEVRGTIQGGAGAAGNVGAQNRVGNANPGQARQIKCYNCNGGHDTSVDEEMDVSPVQDLALNVDNVFQADEYDAFDSDVDEAPTAQTMFMANLLSADPNYDEASPSYDSDILSEIAQSVFVIEQNKVVNASLTTELATYKEQVELYERWAKFKLTKREQKIEEQLRIVITDRNIKEENLKKELHSVKMQLNSTIDHNKSTIEEDTSLKKDFKQKENKYLEEFLDMKALKEKDVLNMKAEALKEQTTTSRQFKALTVYPPNTPATLIPGVLPTKRANSCTDVSGSKPRSNTKKNRISLAKSVNKKKVEEHPETNKSSLKNTNHVDPSIISKRTQTKNISTSKTVITEKLSNTSQKPLTSYQRRNKQYKEIATSTPTPTVTQTLDTSMQSDIVLWYLDSGYSKHMTRDRSRLRNFMKKFIGTVRFGNDHFVAIMRYGDYVIGDSVISRVYYVEGLGHNLFSIRQFCDSDLEVAFRKHSCYVRDTYGVELIKGSRGCKLYIFSVEDMMKSSPICLLWHRRLNHLNFGTINDLTRKDLVRGLPRLKFEKDHLCSACQLGLLGFKFFRSKDETPEFVIKFFEENTDSVLTKLLRYIRTIMAHNFAIKTDLKYYESVGIFTKKSVPMTPQQNNIVERWNRTLVEAARTMLIFSKAPMFPMVRSLFGALCYPINDNEDLGKLQPTADIRIFVGYAPNRKGYKIYNKRNRRIMETIHVQFDELSELIAPVQLSTGLAPMFLTHRQISSGLVPNPVPATPYVTPTNKELEILFQPMFDEYLKPSCVEKPVSPTPAVPIPVNSADTPSSTTIDQDAPSPSHSPSSSALKSPCSHQGVATGSTIIEDNPFAPIDYDPFVNVFAPKPNSEASSSGDVSSGESTHVT